MNTCVHPDDTRNDTSERLSTIINRSSNIPIGPTTTKNRPRETSRNPLTSALFHTAEIAFITFKLKAERGYYSKRRNIGEGTDLGKSNPLAIAPLTKSHQLRTYVFQQPRYVRATTLRYYQFATVSKFWSV